MADQLVTIRQTGIRDINRAMRAVEEKALAQALAKVRAAVDRAALEAAKSIQHTIDTSGAGMPYKHNPDTDARVWTGAMRDSVGVDWERDDAQGISVTIGFLDTPEYTKFQEQGTGRLRAMASLAAARARAEDILDSTGLVKAK